MGWFGYKKEEAEKKDFIKNVLMKDCFREDIELVDSATVLEDQQAALFLAIKIPSAGTVHGVAVCVRSNPDDGEIEFKPIDETMGPADYRCPDHILALLTPTDNLYANEWRAKSRQFNQQAKPVSKQSFKPKMKF